MLALFRHFLHHKHEHVLHRGVQRVRQLGNLQLAAHSEVLELLSSVNILYDSEIYTSRTLIWIIRMGPRNNYVQHLANHVQCFAAERFRRDFIGFPRLLQFHSKRGIPRKREIMVASWAAEMPPFCGIVERTLRFGIQCTLDENEQMDRERMGGAVERKGEVGSESQGMVRIENKRQLQKRRNIKTDILGNAHDIVLSTHENAHSSLYFMLQRYRSWFSEIARPFTPTCVNNPRRVSNDSCDRTRP